MRKIADAAGNLFTRLKPNHTKRSTLLKPVAASEDGHITDNSRVFLYSAIHDIKSPLNNIQALAGLLRKDLEAENVSHASLYAEKIEQLAEQLQNNIRTLTDKIKMETDPYNDISTINFLDILDEILAENESAVKRENVSIEHQFNVEEINYSRSALKSIMQNLITNAIKYRSPSRIVHIKLSTIQKNGQVIFKISDNGLGIDLRRNGSKLFKVFRRIHNHIDGSGLGLFLVKNILEKKGGKIEVESTLNKGSAFKVTF